MVSTERLLVSTCFVTHYYRHPLVSHPAKMNIYTVLQNQNGISCLTVIENKRQMTMPYDGRNHKQHALQAGILNNCDEECKMILRYTSITILSVVLIISQ
jgi:hypothetical protein